MIVSPQVINEVCVNLIKKAQFSEPQVQQLIESFYAKYVVVEVSKGRCQLVEGLVRLPSGVRDAGA